MARFQTLTRLDVMPAVRAAAANAQETWATVAHLSASGQVRLSDGAVGAMRDLLVTTDAAA